MALDARRRLTIPFCRQRQGERCPGPGCVLQGASSSAAGKSGVLVHVVGAGLYPDRVVDDPVRDRDRVNTGAHMVEGAFHVALNHANYGSERHDSWFGVEALTRTTRGSPGNEYSVSNRSVSAAVELLL